MTNGNDMAYPLDAGEGILAGGLTKREYFAAMAMQGMQADNPGLGCTPEYIAKYAVRMADALIAELNK